MVKHLTMRGDGPPVWSRTFRSSFFVRVMLVPALVVTLFVAMFLVGGIALRTQQDAMRAVVETDLERSAHLAQINSRLQSANTDIYRLISQAAARDAGRDKDPEKDLTASVRDVAQRVHGIIADLQDYRGNEVAALQGETLDRFIDNLQTYEVAIDWIVSMLEVDFRASNAFISPYNNHVDQLSQQLSTIIAETTATAKMRADQASRALRRMVYSYLAAAAGVSILVALFGYLSGKRHEFLFAAAQQKSQQVAELLDNSGQGFLSFGADLVVDDACSRACADMLGDGAPGRTADSLLFPEDAAARKLLRDCVEDAMTESDPDRKALFLSLIPSEIRVGGKILEAEYIPIESGIMVVLSDATEERKLAERVRQESLRMEMIVAAVTDGADFFAAIDEFRGFATSGEAEWRHRDPADLYRTLHTFKGTFNQYGFQHLPDALHAIESVLQERQDQTTDGEEDVALVFAVDWSSLLDRDLSIIIDALGTDFIARRGVVTLPPEQAERFQTLAAELLESGDLSDSARAIATELVTIRSISLRKELSEFDGLIRRIAPRLGKEIAPLLIEGEDVRIDPDTYRPFLRSLGHIFRNAIDHGIEDPDIRLATGKTEEGAIICRISRLPGALTLDIADDGGGIDEESLRRHAGQHAAETRDWPLADLLFLDGLSSRDEATELSGRGVGLAAVRAEVKRLGGEVRVLSRPQEGTCFSFRIPLV